MTVPSYRMQVNTATATSPNLMKSSKGRDTTNKRTHSQSEEPSSILTVEEKRRNTITAAPSLFAQPEEDIPIKDPVKIKVIVYFWDNIFQSKMSSFGTCEVADVEAMDEKTITEKIGNEQLLQLMKIHFDLLQKKKNNCLFVGEYELQCNDCTVEKVRN